MDISCPKQSAKVIKIYPYNYLNYIQQNQNLDEQLTDWYKQDCFAAAGLPTIWKYYLENSNARILMITTKKRTSAVVNG